MKLVQLGQHGPLVSRMGLGCMGMSEFYGTTDEAEALSTLARAVELGVTLFDTADMYGAGANESLIGKALKQHRDKVLIATKFGIMRDPSNPKARGISGRPDYVRSSCEASLKRLGVDVIDLYYQHRVDVTVPIEETVGAMKQLIEEGKVRYLGLSEASVTTLERAHKVHPITALQTEYSLWTRDVESDILPAVRRLGIGFVSYSPLGRGFLTGRFRQPQDLEDTDTRRATPRFEEKNFQKNLVIVKQLEAFAAQKGCTTAQLVLAWSLAQGDDIVPIPGTKQRKYLEENLAALTVPLSPRERDEISDIASPEKVAGTRFPKDKMHLVNR